MGNGLVALEKGFYTDAISKGIDAPSYLTQLVNPEAPEVEAAYERCLKRFKQVDDGSPRCSHLWNYAYSITGLEKELMARGIRARGPGADTVEKSFFSSSNNTPLFPVYLATQIIAGILTSSLVPYLTATEVRINSHVAQKITLADTVGQRQLRWTGEGADLPTTKIARTEGSITLYKYGRMLQASYESIRLMHLDIFGLMLQRIGMQIGIDETDDCLETLTAGDGTSASAMTATSTAANGTMTYDDVVNFRFAFPLGYELQHVVAPDAQLRKILAMAEFKDPLAGFNFQRTGQVQDPLGAMWHRWTSTGSATFGNYRFIGVDGRGASALYREGDMLEEADQLIDKQLYRRTMSEWVGFMKLDNNASQGMNNN